VQPPRGALTLRPLMAAVAVLALILALGAALLQTREPHMTIRVFNKTVATLGDLQYDFASIGASESGGGSTSGVLAPGEMISWEVSFSGHANFTFSCTTPDGSRKSSHAEVNVEEVKPGSLDFYVEPTGVRAAIVPRSRWLP
jgi:hypothetical protein